MNLVLVKVTWILWLFH